MIMMGDIVSIALQKNVFFFLFHSLLREAGRYNHIDVLKCIMDSSLNFPIRFPSILVINNNDR